MSKLRLIPYAVLTAGSMVAGSGAYAQSMSDINRQQDYQQDRIERGVRNPTLLVLERLAKALKLAPGALLE